MPAIQLKPATRREMRAQAHHLDPVVMVGAEGLSPAVLREADAALNAHGLIKVRVFSDERDSRETLFAALCDQLGAAPVQHIGKLLVLWRPLPEKERVVREDRLPGPKIVRVVKAAKSVNHRPQVKKLRVLGNERLTAGGTVKRAKKRMVSQKKTAARG